jgi:hypothetical protein
MTAEVPGPSPFEARGPRGHLRVTELRCEADQIGMRMISS